MKELSSRPGESVNRQVPGDDDRDGIKNGAVDVAGGGEKHVVEFVFLAVAKAQLAVNVLHHDDGAVNDDAEIDGANGEQVCGFTGLMEKNKSEKKCERDCE